MFYYPVSKKKSQCILFYMVVEAIAMINNQGLYINQKKALNPNEVITQSVHMLPNKTTIVRVG